MKLLMGVLLFVGLVGCGESSLPAAQIPSGFSLNAMDLTSASSGCQNPASAKDPACFASNPDYCANPEYASEPACVLSQPDYCESQAFAQEPACFASRPAYCQSEPNAEPSCVDASQLDRLALYCQGFDRLGLCPPQTPAAKLN